jgi:hypothetical protein
MKVQVVTFRRQLIPAGVIIGGFLETPSSSYLPQIIGDWSWGQASSNKAFILRGSVQTIALIGSDPHDATIENRVRGQEFISVDNASGTVLQSFLFTGELEIWSKTGSPDDPGTVWFQSKMRELSQAVRLSWGMVFVALPQGRSSSQKVLPEVDVDNMMRLGFTWEAQDVQFAAVTESTLIKLPGGGSLPAVVPYFEPGSGEWEGRSMTIWARCSVLMSVHRDLAPSWESTYGVYRLTDSVVFASLGDAIRLLSYLQSRQEASHISLDVLSNRLPGAEFSTGGAAVQLGVVSSDTKGNISCRFAVVTPVIDIAQCYFDSPEIGLSPMFVDTSADSSRYAMIQSEGSFARDLYSVVQSASGASSVEFVHPYSYKAAGGSYVLAFDRYSLAAVDEADTTQILASAAKHVWVPGLFACSSLFMGVGN